jgi:hypothetical protein
MKESKEGGAPLYSSADSDLPFAKFRKFPVDTFNLDLG